jgi:hypothetical protein
MTPEEYKIYRLMRGIPEGLDDFTPGVLLPQESNLDYMNGGAYSDASFRSS